MFIVCKATECPPDAIVIPFLSEINAQSVADALNEKTRTPTMYSRGPAHKYADDLSVVYELTGNGNDPIYHFLPGKGWVPFL